MTYIKKETKVTKVELNKEWNAKPADGQRLSEDINTMINNLGKNKVFKQSSGFNLGLINDPNMSLIIKAQDDDPNQLFSLR